MDCKGCSAAKYCGTVVSSTKLCSYRKVYEGLSDEELKEIAIELENNI